MVKICSVVQDRHVPFLVFFNREHMYAVAAFFSIITENFLSTRKKFQVKKIFKFLKINFLRVSYHGDHIEPIKFFLIFFRNFSCPRKKFQVKNFFKFLKTNFLHVSYHGDHFQPIKIFSIFDNYLINQLANWVII